MTGKMAIKRILLFIVVLTAIVCLSIYARMIVSKTSLKNFEKPYTATYDYMFEGKVYPYTVSSDGKGHKRWIASGIAPSHGLNDYQEGKHYEQGAGGKYYWREFIMNDVLTDEEYVKSDPWVGSLGEQIFGDLHCRGWNTRAKMPNSSRYERWYEIKTGCLVTCVNAGNIEIRLTKLVSEPLPKEEFQIPAKKDVVPDPVWQHSQ